MAILDKFDALVNDLTAGLPAEIEARRKQYEYYRNKLLNFNRFKAINELPQQPPDVRAINVRAINVRAIHELPLQSPQQKKIMNKYEI